MGVLRMRSTFKEVVVLIYVTVVTGALVTLFFILPMALTDWIEKHCRISANWQCLEQHGWSGDAWIYPFLLIALPLILYVWRQEQK
jgi:hypothetical protein